MSPEMQSTFCKIYTPYALNSFAIKAGELWPYLRQSAIKVPKNEASAVHVARSLPGYANKLVNRFWQESVVQFEPFSSRNQYWSENLLRAFNRDDHDLGTVRAVNNELNVRYIMPTKFNASYMNGHNELSSVAMVPWAMQGRLHEQFIEALISKTEMSREEYDAAKENLLANTKLFALFGTANQLILGTHQFRDGIDRNGVPYMAKTDYVNNLAAMQYEYMFKKILPEVNGYQTIEDSAVFETFSSAIHEDANPAREIVKNEYIKSFLNRDACSFTVSPQCNRPAMSTFYHPFYKGMVEKFKASQASRIMFNNGSHGLEEARFVGMLDNIVFNLVWITPDETGADTIYPFFVGKQAIIDVSSRIAFSVEDVYNAANYDEHGHFKKLEGMDWKQHAFEIGVSQPIKIRSVRVAGGQRAEAEVEEAEE